MSSHIKYYVNFYDQVLKISSYSKTVALVFKFLNSDLNSHNQIYNLNTHSIFLRFVFVSSDLLLDRQVLLKIMILQ